MNNLLGTVWSMMAREVATFVRAVRDCGNKLHATPHRSSLEEGCSPALVETTKAKLWSNSAGYVEHWVGGQREKCFEREKEHVPPFVAKQCFSKRCRSLESIHTMRRPVRFRHLSPHPHKSVVMAQVFHSDGWKTDGHDQTLLLLDDAITHGFLAECNCLARKQQVSRRLQCEMSRRSLTRCARWSVKFV